MGLLSKFFGGGKSKEKSMDSVVNETIQGIIEKSQFNLSFDVKFDEREETEVVELDFFGEDEEILKERDGQLLDAFQLYATRVVQHNFPEKRINVNVDCNGFREESNQALVELADKLKGIALEKKKSVYFRALPPKDRKVIHQYLAEDGRVKSRSIGDGHYKKIKIYPAK